MRSIALIALLFVSGVTMSQTLTRKAVFAKDQQLEKVAVMKVSFGMDMMGQTIEITSDNNMTSVLAVKGMTGKDYNIASTVKHIVSRTGAMGQDMSYDSDKPEDNDSEMGKGLKGLVNKTTNLTVNDKGFVTATDDSSTQIGGMPTQMAGMAGSLMGGLSGGLNKPGGTFEAIAPLPDRVLKTGDTWSDSTTDKEGKQVSNYKVTSINGNEAIVAIDGTMNRKGETEANGMTINMDMKCKMTGEMTVEVATGIVKKRTLNMDGTGNMEMMGQAVPFNLKMTMGETIAQK